MSKREYFVDYFLTGLTVGMIIVIIIIHVGIVAIINPAMANQVCWAAGYGNATYFEIGGYWYLNKLVCLKESHYQPLVKTVVIINKEAK